LQETYQKKIVMWTLNSFCQFKQV